MEHIKVNIPENIGDYKSGNGEGCWVIVDDDVKRAYDNDENGTVYEGILDNDCWCYPELLHGIRIQFEMRGKFRPVASVEYLQEQYGIYVPDEDENH